MSKTDRTTTRRSALQSALTGLLAAGAASMLPTTTSAAPEPVSVHQDRVMIANVVDHAGLIVESKRAAEKSRQTLQAAIVASEALRATLTEGQAHLFSDFDEAMVEHHLAHSDYEIAELMRHFPGLAPAIFAVVDHMHSTEGMLPPGDCCEPELEI